MVEHLTCNQTVVGSIPTTSSTKKTGESKRVEQLTCKQTVAHSIPTTSSTKKLV